MVSPNMKVTNDPSRPLLPPVKILEPIIPGIITHVSGEIPETTSPEMAPKKNFHAQCIPIGIHRLFRNLYAATNMNPASTDIAIAVQKSTVDK